MSSAIVSLGILLPLGLLAFAALGADADAVGIRAAFTTSVVGGLVAALVGGTMVPGSGPTTSISLIFAVYVATLVADPQLSTARGLDLETLLLLTSLCVGVAGILQMAFALLRLGSLISFVPLPVVAGFMDGIAILVMFAQIRSLLGLPRSAGWVELVERTRHVQVGGPALGIATAALCWMTLRRWPRAPWALLGIVAGSVAYAVAGLVFPEASFGPLLEGAAMGPLAPRAWSISLSPVTMALVRAHLPNLMTTAVLLAVIGSMDTLLSALAVDAQIHSRHDSNRLLLGKGLGNLACAIFGGLPMAGSASAQMAAYRAGAHSRNSGIVCALTLLLVMLAGERALRMIPLAVLAGVMFIVALGLFDRWSAALWRRLRAGSRDRDAMLSLCVVAIVCAVTIVYGFVVAIAVGIVLATVLLVIALNGSLVRGVATGETRGSRRIYEPEQAQMLRRQGAQIRVIELEGAIFFGTAYRLGQHVEELSDGTRYLILDMRRVTMIDGSGATALERMAARLAKNGVLLLLAGVVDSHRNARALRAYAALPQDVDKHWYVDADHALEYAERGLLEAAGERPRQEELPLERLSMLEGMDAAQVERLRRHLTRIELEAQETLFQRGEPGDRLYVLARGSISVVAGSDEDVASTHRLASFAPGVIIGEMAMLDGGGRSASGVADEASVLYMLTRAEWDTIGEREPTIARLLLLNIARQLSARLRFTSAASLAAER